MRAAVVCLAIALAACRPATGGAASGASRPITPAASTTEPPRERAPLRVVRRGARRPEGDAPVLWADVAATDAERSRGLGGRTKLDPDHGMVFVYPAPTERLYWMKDCTFALDIAFVAPDGRILTLATLPAPAPGTPDDAIARAASGGRVLWVVEADAGWFERHGIRTGDRVDVSAAVAGVRAE